MFIRKNAMLAALSAAVLASSASRGSSPPLTERQLEAMRQSMSREIWPYAGVEDDAPDPRDAEAFVEFLVPSDGRVWNHGTPRQLLDVIPIAPAHFAPAIHERLMRVPATLDEYAIVDPRWSISRPSKEWPYPMHLSIFPVVEMLDRASAEPILREFTEAIRPLALEAQRRYREIRSQRDAEWNRLGRPVGDAMDDHESLRLLRAESTRARTVSDALTGAWTRAVSIAGRLGSPAFVDDVIALLGDPDPLARRMGSWMTPYVLNFADQRPEVVEKLRQATESLSRSTIPTDIEAARAIQKSLDDAMNPAKP